MATNSETLFALRTYSTLTVGLGSINLFTSLLLIHYLDSPLDALNTTYVAFVFGVMGMSFSWFLVQMKWIKMMVFLCVWMEINYVLNPMDQHYALPRVEPRRERCVF